MKFVINLALQTSKGIEQQTIFCDQLPDQCFADELRRRAEEVAKEPVALLVVPMGTVRAFSPGKRDRLTVKSGAPIKEVSNEV